MGEIARKFLDWICSVIWRPRRITPIEETMQEPMD